MALKCNCYIAYWINVLVYKFCGVVIMSSISMLSSTDLDSDEIGRAILKKKDTIFVDIDSQRRTLST